MTKDTLESSARVNQLISRYLVKRTCDLKRKEIKNKEGPFPLCTSHCWTVPLWTSIDSLWIFMQANILNAL